MFGSRIDYVPGYEKRIMTFSTHNSRWYRIGLPIFALLVISMVLACSSTTPKQQYENPEFGISLEKPKNWDVGFYERNGSIILEAENGIRKKDSVRIEIFGYACVPTQADNPVEELETNIDRIRTLYDLDSITIVQDPIGADIGDLKATSAIVTVPTMSLPKDSPRNLVGDRGPGIFQTIDMHAIRDANNNSIMVYIYEGSNEQLNAEAEHIVDSIEFTCSIEP